MRNESAPTQNFSCQICFGSGVEIVPGRGARSCVCALKAERERKIAKIPVKFQGLTLSNLQPLPAKHPKQSEFVPYIKANPEKSYFLAGKPGTGKSTFMWALYRQAIEGRNHVVICTLSDLLDEYRAYIGASMRREEPQHPRLSSWQLAEGRPYSIFLDDIDKANPTDYAAEQIFKLVNAIYEHRHQLVVTTNKSIEGLIRHYDKSDDRGEAIVRRMMDGAKVMEMF